MLQSSISYTLGELYDFLNDYTSGHKDVTKMQKAMKDSLSLALDLGLGHLSFIRKLKGISGSEYQRLLLVKYMGHKTSDSFYILR